ncbi:MAG: glycine cleavage system protein H [Legionellales bacterium RIFCSPHIGHO2_12_FULL_35_11]|nr:MAG: glycine cleavage system protein H [Legionellales bacterium RIFCSPHIGHO2_12_FULL_35_11]
MSNLRYSKSHEWIDVDAAEEMPVGITSHAQDLLGDMVYIELPAIGKDVQMGEELGVLESVKAASDFYSPISGVVVAVNQKVVDDPSILNKDPYGAGWLVKIKAHSKAQLITELNDLFKEDVYLKDFTED